jgi:hypothetical protein
VADPVEQPVIEHGLRPGSQLFGWLEYRYQRARPRATGGGQFARRSEQAGYVHVMAARVHHRDVVPVPVGGSLLAGIGKARFFPDRQRVHVGADQCGRPGAVSEDAGHAGTADTRRDLEPRGGELVSRQRRGAMLLLGQLGAGVQIAVQLFQIGRASSGAKP